MWRTWGEKIAAGQPTVAKVMAAWLASPGHCAKLMNPNVRDIGVACVSGGAGNTCPTCCTMLLGVRAVVATSFERIHRSNLIGMGVLPLQFKVGDSWQSLGLNGSEPVDVRLADQIQPLSDATLVITGTDGTRHALTVTLRIDTAIEVDCCRHGGILPCLLRPLLAG